MKKKRILLPFVLAVFVFACGCGDSGRHIEETPDAEAKEPVKVVVSCSEKEPAVMYRVDFRTGKIEETVFGEEPSKTERAYTKADELKRFVEEQIVPTYGADSGIDSSTAANDEEQKLLWNIKITYEDEALIFSSFTTYPDYWDELIQLLT